MSCRRWVLVARRGGGRHFAIRPARGSVLGTWGRLSHGSYFVGTSACSVESLLYLADPSRRCFSTSPAHRTHGPDLGTNTTPRLQASTRPCATTVCEHLAKGPPPHLGRDSGAGPAGASPSFPPPQPAVPQVALHPSHGAELHTPKNKMEGANGAARGPTNMGPTVAEAHNFICAESNHASVRP